jgi:hypothetical protein
MSQEASKDNEISQDFEELVKNKEESATNKSESEASLSANSPEDEDDDDNEEQMQKQKIQQQQMQQQQMQQMQQYQMQQQMGPQIIYDENGGEPQAIYIPMTKEEYKRRLAIQQLRKIQARIQMEKIKPRKMKFV